MKQDVATAIDELRCAFPDTSVWSEQDSEGGAYVILENVDIGSRYVPTSAWIGGHVTALYPLRGHLSPFHGCVGAPRRRR